MCDSLCGCIGDLHGEWMATGIGIEDEPGLWVFDGVEELVEGVLFTAM